MLYREIIDICSEIHKKHINTLCGQNVVFLNIKTDGINSYHWSLNNILMIQIYQVFTPVVNQRMVFLSHKPCSVLRDFGGSSFLYLQGDGILCR